MCDEAKRVRCHAALHVAHPRWVGGDTDDASGVLGGVIYKGGEYDVHNGRRLYGTITKQTMTPLGLANCQWVLRRPRPLRAQVCCGTESVGKTLEVFGTRIAFWADQTPKLRSGCSNDIGAHPAAVLVGEGDKSRVGD